MRSLAFVLALVAIPTVAWGQSHAPDEIVLVDTPFTAPESTVVVRSLVTGAERVVATLPHVSGYGAAGSVSPDGRWLAVTVLAQGNRLWRHASVYLVDLQSTTAAPRRVLAEAMFAAPAWLSNTVALAPRNVGEHEPAPAELRAGQLMEFDIELVAIDAHAAPGTTPSVAFRDRAQSLELVGLDARGDLVAARSDHAGSALVAIHPGGSARTLLDLGGPIAQWAHLAPDGRSVVFAQQTGGRGAGLYAVISADLDGHAREIARDANEHFCPMPLATGTFATSRDGHSISLVTEHGAGKSLLASDASALRLVGSRASADGTLLAFERNGPGGTHVFVAHVTASDAPVEVGDGQHWRETMGFRGAR